MQRDKRWKRGISVYLDLDGNNRAVDLGPAGKRGLDKVWPVPTDSLVDLVGNATEIELNRRLGGLGRLECLSGL